MKLTLVPGRYFAGVDIPFFVPNAKVRSAVEKLGGRGVTITDREGAVLPFDPREDPRYSDDWDEVVTVDYPGPRKTIDTPRHWKWLMVIERPASSTTPASTPAASSVPSSRTEAPASAATPARERSGAGLLLVGAAASFALLAWRRARRR